MARSLEPETVRKAMISTPLLAGLPDEPAQADIVSTRTLLVIGAIRYRDPSRAQG
jgi:hypothetical protein